MTGALALADGTVFTGERAGAEGSTVGEVVFTTSMTGYQEILTDPSYAGQIITMTSPHIGNYGVVEEDEQAAVPSCSGFIVRALSRRASNWRSQGLLSDYLARHGIVALSGLDTRRLTRHLRAAGAMAGAMGPREDVPALIERARAHGSMSGRDLASAVTRKGPALVPASGPSQGHVVAYDLGIKRDIVTQLSDRGLDVTIVPAGTPAQAVMAEQPDGVFLSNGPGDPEPVQATIQAVRDLLGHVPVFGICLGHQILGLALGARTYKLPFGHHGGNHPVRRLADGSVQITSQNHGFAVDLWHLAGDEPPTPRPDRLPGREMLPAEVSGRFGYLRPTHQNLNDGTLEGLACDDVAAFSVQYHPEAAPGPNDALRLFDDFVAAVT